MEKTEKKRRGRKPHDKVLRGYTIDRPIAAFLDALPDGDRSKYVNEALREKIAHERREP